MDPKAAATTDDAAETPPVQSQTDEPKESSGGLGTETVCPTDDCKGPNTPTTKS